MSKLTFRIILSLAVSLVIIAGAYASVQALSLIARQESKGMYLLNGSFDKSFSQPSTAGDDAVNPHLDLYENPSGKGRGGCESEMDSSDF